MELNAFDFTTPSNTTITNVSAANNTFAIVEKIPILYWHTYLWAFANICLLICILGGNALTIMAVRTCRRLRRSISNMFICSLAVSDFIVGSSLPYHLAFYLGLNWDHMYVMCLLRFYLIIFACCVSVLTLITISIDRYIAIVYPLHYTRFITRRVAKLLIGFAWCVGAAVAAVPMFWNNWSTALKCEFNEVLPLWYMAGIIIPGFVIIWTLMFFMYGRIMKIAAKQAKQFQNQAALRRTNNLHPDWRSVQVVIFIMGCFTVCWFSYFIVVCTQIFNVMPPLLYKVAFSLAITNSAFNPVVYAWKNSDFRKAFLRLLKCKSPNCYQTSAELNQKTPKAFSKIFLKSNKKCSPSKSSIKTPIRNNVEKYTSRATDWQLNVANGNKRQLEIESLSEIYTVPLSTPPYYL